MVYGGKAWVLVGPGGGWAAPVVTSGAPSWFSTFQADGVASAVHMKLLKKCTYFVFQREFYQHIFGASMGSPVSQITCNLYKEQLKVPWQRPHTDPHTLLKEEQSEAFTYFLNSIDPDIKCMTDKGVEDGGLAFLDTNAIQKKDGSLKFRVYQN